MENKQSTIIKVLIAIIALLSLSIAYLLTGNDVHAPQTVHDNLTTEKKSLSEEDVIAGLKVSWKDVQKSFSVKAGESGMYNAPSKIQFLSSNVLLINYDDGLNDHVSLITYTDNQFIETVYVGAMSTFTEQKWKELVHRYAAVGYPVTSYVSKDYATYTRVAENIFVK